jgi:hypothetical protein
MKSFSAALSGLDNSDFTPQASSEAKHSQVATAEEAAISRLCPVQDGYDFWELNGCVVFANHVHPPMEAPLQHTPVQALSGSFA